MTDVMTDVTTVRHWIGGAPVESASTRTSPVFDPALGVETKRVVLADDADIEAAVAAARAAFPGWRDMSLAKRQSVLFRFRELLNERKGELAEIITSEHGKVLDDAMGEISRGQEVVEFATGLAHHLKGEYSEQVSTGIDVYSASPKTNHPPTPAKAATPHPGARPPSAFAGRPQRQRPRPAASELTCRSTRTLPPDEPSRKRLSRAGGPAPRGPTRCRR